MVVQYASDLHLEFPSNREFLKANPLKPRGQIMILAGDILPFKLMDQCDDFFNFLSNHFEATYWIPGNHEYYGYDLSLKHGVFHESIKPNVHLLNNKAVSVGGTKLIFSTLWSRISPANQWAVASRLNDFRLIRDGDYTLSVEKYNELHDESLTFITTEMQRNHPNGKTIVVTHHVPTFEQYPAEYKGDVLNEAFAVELHDFILASQPDAWIFGHHHRNRSAFTIGATSLLTNQLGYVKYNEHLTFGRGKVIDV